MTDATVTSVALPNGIDAARGVARLSIFLTLRIEANGEERLEPFGDFHDWPAKLRAASLRFLVSIEGGADLEARVVGDPPRSALWTAVFSPDSFVRPHTTDAMVGRHIVRYPHRQLASYVKGRYQDI